MKVKKGLKWFFGFKKPVYLNWWLWVIGFFVSIGTTFVINELYCTDFGYKTQWGASDALLFYGAYLAFIGTVVLGALALWQNKKATALNVEMQKLQQANFISIVSLANIEVTLSLNQELKPNFYNIEFKDQINIDLNNSDFKCKSFYYIDTNFKNDSAYPIVEISAHAGNIGDANYTIYGLKSKYHEPIYIDRNSPRNIRFVIPADKFMHFKKNNIAINLWFTNIFDYTTKATLFCDFIDKSATKYRLAKFTDIRPKEEK